MKILVIGGISHSLINFRGPLLCAMRDAGYEVLACGGEPRADVAEKLNDLGIRFEPVHLSRTGMRPWEDLRTCWELWCLMRDFQPDVVLAYTIKPVIWGGLAARFSNGIEMYSLITGLGYAFVKGNGLRGKIASWMATMLYQLSLNMCKKVFFQNPDDMEEFTKRCLVKSEQCLVVNGSGIDLLHYGLAPLPLAPRFLMICRLLGDKGVREYVQAARTLKNRYPSFSARLVGALDSNPASVTQDELDQWVKEGVIDYIGVLDDVRSAIEDCSIFVLPSYREGTPRTVLEAMSMGRPIITTNAPGCRETVLLQNMKTLDKESKDVIKGENGFLVPPRNVEKLLQAMEQFVNHPELILQMGRRSRLLAEEKYNVHKVNALILHAMGLN